VLDLSSNYICDQGTEHVAAALQANVSLTSVNLQSNRIGAFGANFLAEALLANTTLRSVDLSQNQMGSACAVAAIQANSVSAIDIHDNDIGDEGAGHLADALGGGNVTLKRLNLCNTGVGDRGAELLARALQVNTTITSLALGGNDIGNVGSSAIAVALKNSTSMASLDLQYNYMGIAGAEAFAVALETNRSLTCLGLSNQSVGDPGACSLAASLLKNTTLASLDLRSNSIGKPGANAFANSMLDNENASLNIVAGLARNARPVVVITLFLQPSLLDPSYDEQQMTVTCRSLAGSELAVLVLLCKSVVLDLRKAASAALIDLSSKHNFRFILPDGRMLQQTMNRMPLYTLLSAKGMSDDAFNQK